MTGVNKQKDSASSDSVKISANDAVVISDWNQIRIAEPENLQNRVRGIKETNKIIKKQKNANESGLSTVV